MRGKRPCSQPPTAGNRITPAYAGKTAAGLSDCRAGWDHPRVCGENITLSYRLRSLSGSPPRMRGKRFRVAAEGCRKRITPAYAGKTKPTCKPPSAKKDHPRVCGENYSVTALHRRVKGSPPRMRGKLSLIMPTVLNSEDHPRVCGENTASSLTAQNRIGSPPRMRGKRANKTAEVGVFRITPAYAGKTPFLRTFRG